MKIEPRDKQDLHRPVMRWPGPLLLLALVLAGCSGSGIATAVKATKTTVYMAIPPSFSPVSVTVQAGSVVEWVNPGGMPHTVTPDVATPGMDSATQFPSGMQLGDKFDWTVPATAVSGTKYFYHCLYHGTAGSGGAVGTGMAGVVVVK